METLLIIFLLSIFIDLVFGELPSKIHPVVWIGKTIKIFSRPLLSYNSRISGFFLLFITITIFLLIFLIILLITYSSLFFFLLISSIALSSMFAINILLKSAMNIRNNIYKDIGKTRILVSYLVSRDTSKLSDEEIVSATIESLTENINDSVIAPLFYFFISYPIVIYLAYQFQLPVFITIVVPILITMIFRIVNTLDAMVGYKSPKYYIIGWFPATFDDWLNFIPSRITGILVVISAYLLRYDGSSAWKIMLRDANKTPSPNSGFPMAAAAGSLHVQLNKIGIYKLGDPERPLTSDVITEAINLSGMVILLFIVIVSLLLFTIYQI